MFIYNFKYLRKKEEEKKENILTKKVVNSLILLHDQKVKRSFL